MWGGGAVFGVCTISNGVKLAIHMATNVTVNLSSLLYSLPNLVVVTIQVTLFSRLFCWPFKPKKNKGCYVTAILTYTDTLIWFLALPVYRKAYGSLLEAFVHAFIDEPLARSISLKGWYSAVYTQLRWLIDQLLRILVDLVYYQGMDFLSKGFLDRPCLLWPTLYVWKRTFSRFCLFRVCLTVKILTLVNKHPPFSVGNWKKSHVPYCLLHVFYMQLEIIYIAVFFSCNWFAKRSFMFVLVCKPFSVFGETSKRP